MSASYLAVGRLVLGAMVSTVRRLRPRQTCLRSHVFQHESHHPSPFAAGGFPENMFWKQTCIPASARPRGRACVPWPLPDSIVHDGKLVARPAVRFPDLSTPAG